MQWLKSNEKIDEQQKNIYEMWYMNMKRAVRPDLKLFGRMKNSYFYRDFCWN
jgi:hypothetical protein